MDYIEQVSAGMFDHAAEAIDKASEEHGEVNTSLPIETQEKEVEAGESTQDFADQGLRSPTVDEKEKGHVDRNPDAQYTRTTAFDAASGDVTLKTPDSFEEAETTKERLAELRSVNEELERQGDKRRYVASKADAPGTAQLYKDDFGTYYYKQLEVDVRPSDVANYADVKAVVALDEDDRALKTIELMSAMYADPLLDASTQKAAETWLDRHLVLTDDDPGSNDTFSHEFKSHIANLIAQAGSSDEDTAEKQWRYVDNPSDAPDDVSVEEGPQGGYRYQVDDTEEEDSGGGAGDEGGGDLPDNVGNMSYDDQMDAAAQAVVDDIPEDADFNETFEIIEDFLDENPELDTIPDDVYQQVSDEYGGGGGGAGDEGGGDQETTMGFSGEMPWGEDTQSAASGIASDVGQEAGEGGAYQGRDRQEVLDIAEENAREYAEEADVPMQEFIEEVRTQVEMQLDQP